MATRNTRKEYAIESCRAYGSDWSLAQSSAMAGNYLSSGIFGISIDLRNFGTTDLTIRLLFEDPIPGPPLNTGVTTFGAFFRKAPAGLICSLRSLLAI